MRIFAKPKLADVAFGWTLSLTDYSLNETCKDGLKFQYHEDSTTYSIMRENHQQRACDSGAGGTFIDDSFCRKYKIPTFALKKPLSVYNIDGTPNRKGTITQVAWFTIEIDEVPFTIQWHVTKLGDQQMILGLPWLCLYNSLIDWDKGTIFIDERIKE